jgi:hypothetical protein
VATETQRGPTAEKTKPGAIFRDAIKATTGRATGEAGPQPSRRSGTGISRLFARSAKKHTGRKAVVCSLPSTPRAKNIVVSFAQAAAHMMDRLARDIEKALGFGPSAGEIERRKECADAAQRAYEDAEEMKRYREFLAQQRLLTEARGTARPS